MTILILRIYWHLKKKPFSNPGAKCLFSGDSSNLKRSPESKTWPEIDSPECCQASELEAQQKIHRNPDSRRRPHLVQQGAESATRSNLSPSAILYHMRSQIQYSRTPYSRISLHRALRCPGQFFKICTRYIETRPTAPDVECFQIGWKFKKSLNPCWPGKHNFVILIWTRRCIQYTQTHHSPPKLCKVRAKIKKSQVHTSINRR